MGILGDAGSFLSGAGELGGFLLGSDVATSGSGTTKGTTKGTEQIIIDQAAIEKIIADVLGGAEGLASIFQGEQTAGIFDSTVSAQAAGDLASKLVGEIAKLTAVKETTQETDTTQTSKQKQEEGGLLDPILGGISKVFGF
jgi:hypothetical protein